MANLSIYDKIVQKGKLDAKKIRDAGEAEADSFVQSRLKETENAILGDQVKFKEKQDNRFKSKVTEFEQQAKSATLACKQQCLTDVLQEALKKLSLISDEKWMTLVKQLLKKDRLTGTETIVASPQDQVRFRKLFTSDSNSGGALPLDKLNKFLGKGTFQLTLSDQTAPISGGFLVIGKAFDIDHSHLTLLSGIKDRYEAELAQLLFESGV
ncbi:MAG: V-type ATP synthase subunit E [Candidatus Izemoplasmatales bacterium]